MNLPIIKETLNFKKKSPISFFMPGHMRLIYKNDFSKTQKKIYKIYKIFEKNIFDFDVTEVNNFDNLQNPTGIIEKSQNKIKNDLNKIYNNYIQSAYFLINGSTSGVLSILYGLFNENEKIIIDENSHKSVYNGSKLKHLHLAIFKREKNLKYDIFKKINLVAFENFIKNNLDAKGVIITSPDYFGQNLNIKGILEICHKYNMILIVDAAHSMHYNYSSFFKKTMPDVFVSSFHKTLPTLNQTAMIFTSKNISKYKNKKIKEAINIFNSTSPSYIFMANMELTHFLMSKYGEILYSDLYKNIYFFKKNLLILNNNYKKQLELINFKNNNFINILKNDDFSRIVISFEFINLNFIETFFKKNNIFFEMINNKSIVLITNIFHTKSDFIKLLNTFKKLFKFILYKEYNKFSNKLNKRKIINRNEKKYNKKIKILNFLKNNIDNPFNSNLYIYPPGIPIITKNELITKKHIKYIENIIKKDSIDIIY